MRIAAHRSCHDVELKTMTTEQASTLTVLHEGTPIFTSHGNWLYPLLELEAYLADHAFQPAKLFLEQNALRADSENIDPFLRDQLVAR